MRVLMLAAACSPYSGSEPYVGWLWAKAAAQKHEVWLIVADWCMPFIERAKAEGLVPSSLHIMSAGPTRFKPPSHPFWARVFTWVQYREFLYDSQRQASTLAKTISFDLVHQTTLATWRMGMPVANGSLPSVWGPLGGGEKFPLQFLTLVSRSSKFYEISRWILSVTASMNPRVRRAARLANVVISTNSDTDMALQRLGRKGRVIRCPMLLQNSRFEQIVSMERPDNPTGVLRIFAGGGLDGRKGVGVSLEVLSILQSRGVKFRFTVGGHGSELSHLRKTAAALGLEVNFRPELSGAEYLQELAATDVILFPSLRDNTALTLVEATAAGAIPVVIDHGGPGEFVTKECGIKVNCLSVKNTIHSLADSVMKIASGKMDTAGLRKAGRLRVRDFYREDRAEKTLDVAYGMITS